MQNEIDRLSSENNQLKVSMKVTYLHNHSIHNLYNVL